MSKVAIRVEGLGKRYKLGQREPYKTFREAVRSAASVPLRAASSALRRQQEPRKALSDGFIWALRDLSFELEEGEVLGIIGSNGAGKTTLLKLLSRITEPTQGRAQVHGRVGSLLEVGTGFHPELTGRENIYLNGAILGMKKAEIDRKFDEIVAFAGTERFLDTPVKRYSSGMQVRLAFAVAAHLEPEILVVDEVLAVGDAGFQRKCLGKMDEVAKEGRTVLFVSHSMAAVSRLCTRAMLLSSGTCACYGNVEQVITTYLQSSAPVSSGYADLRQAARWDEDRQPIATWMSTLRLDGTEAAEFTTGEGLLIKIGYHVDQEISAYCQLNFFNVLGDRVMTLRSDHDVPALKICGDGVIQCVIRDLRLVSGEYSLMLEIGRQFPQTEWLDCVADATRIRISLGNYLGGCELEHGQGLIAQQSTWTLSD